MSCSELESRSFRGSYLGLQNRSPSIKLVAGEYAASALRPEARTDYCTCLPRLLVVVVVLEGKLLSVAKGISDGAAVHARDLGGRAADELAVLHVEALDLHQRSGVGAIVGDELSDHRERLLGVDFVVLAGTVEVCGPHAVGVQVATVLVTETLPALTVVSVAALDVALTALRAYCAARMWRVGRGSLVGLPDVHLDAADAEGCIRLKLLVGALGITVARAELCAGCVAIAAHAAEGVHLDEVNRPVGAAAELLHVDVKGELFVQELEHLVRVLGILDVESGTHVPALRREVKLHSDGLTILATLAVCGIVVLVVVIVVIVVIVTAPIP